MLYVMFSLGPNSVIRPAPGFTVLELMITLSIASILLLTAVPSFQQFTSKQRMRAAVSSLQNDLMMGRSEAVRLNSSIVSCPGNPATGCSGEIDWSAGWVVFQDLNENRQLDTDDPMLRRGQGQEMLMILGSAGRSTIRFFPDGSAPGSNSSISFCGPGGPPNARKLVISNLGRIRRDTAPNLDSANCPAKP